MGASITASLASGAVSGLGEIVSISNISSAAGTALSVKTAAVVDSVFGSGYSAASTATTQAITSNSQRKKVKVKTSISRPSTPRIKKPAVKMSFGKKAVGTIGRIFSSIGNGLKKLFRWR